MSTKADTATGETAVYGGYEYEFVDKLDSKFYCLVCQSVLRDPILTGCCGQHYCDSCLQQCNNAVYEKQCPHCRQINYSALLDKPLQREIKTLKIYCVNRSLGCRWSDELSKLPRHLDSERDGCEFVRVECILNCGETVTRGHLTKHLHYECPQRPYECGYCGKEDIYITITGDTKMMRQRGKVPEEKGHYAECLEFYTKCPNSCGKTMKRKEMERHRQKCPREQIECTFRGPNETNEMMTCGKKMLRSELSSHEKTCPFRMFECKFCNQASTYAAITGERQMQILTKQPPIPPAKGHYAVCPDYPLFCKNKCQPSEIKRSHMERHLATCPLEPVICPVREAGCQETVRRRDLNEHLSSNHSQHLSLLCSVYTQTRTELGVVRTQLDQACNSLSTTSEKLDTTRTELTKVRGEVATLTSRVAEGERELEVVQKLSQSTRQELMDMKAELERVRGGLQRWRSQKPEREAVPAQQRDDSQPRRRSFWKRK